MDHVFQTGLSVISTIATGIISYLVYRLKKKEEDKDEELKKQRKEAALHVEKQKQEAEALRVSLLALIRDRILQGYRYYRRENGISPQDLETMTKLYMAYHALGGNGTITAVYDKIKNLPIKEG